MYLKNNRCIQRLDIEAKFPDSRVHPRYVLT